MGYKHDSKNGSYYRQVAIDISNIAPQYEIDLKELIVEALDEEIDSLTIKCLCAWADRDDSISEFAYIEPYADMKKILDPIENLFDAKVKDIDYQQEAEEQHRKHLEQSNLREL